MDEMDARAIEVKRRHAEEFRQWVERSEPAGIQDVFNAFVMHKIAMQEAAIEKMLQTFAEHSRYLQERDEMILSEVESVRKLLKGGRHRNVM